LGLGGGVYPGNLENSAEVFGRTIMVDDTGSARAEFILIHRRVPFSIHKSYTQAECSNARKEQNRTRELKHGSAADQ
jgi:hypothetical protein